MRTSEVHGHVSGMSADDVFAKLGDFESYVALGPSIRSLEVEHIDDTTMTSKWDVDFRGGSMRWTEKDTLDPAAGTITFELVEGNLRAFSGSWTVTAAGGGNDVRFRVEFAIGMPSMSSFIDPVAEAAISDNISAVLAGLFGDAYTPKA